MKQTLLSAVIALLVILLAACSQTPAEAGLEPEYGTSVPDTASDAAGNTTGIYVSGSSYGALAGSHLGDSDAYLRKYSFSSVLWQRQVGSSLFDRATDMAIQGNRIYVLGNTNGDNDSDSVIWTKQFGTSGLDFAVDVAADSSGNAMVLSDDSTTNFTLRKVSTKGTVSTVVSYSLSPPKPSYRPAAMVMDNLDNIYVLLDRGETAGDSNVFIFKYSSSGAFLSSITVSATLYDDYARDLRIVGSKLFVLLGENGFSKLKKFPTTISPLALAIETVNLPGNVAAHALKASESSLYVSGYALVPSSQTYVVRYSTGLDWRWSKILKPGLSHGLAVSAGNNAVFLVGTKALASGDSDAFVSRLNMTTDAVVWWR